jgi:hypothetical protein
MKKLILFFCCVVSAMSLFAQTKLVGSWTLTNAERTLLRPSEKPEQTLQNYLWVDAFAKKDPVVFDEKLHCTFLRNGATQTPTYALTADELTFSFTNAEGKVSFLIYQISDLSDHQFVLRREDPLLREVYHFTR